MVKRAKKCVTKNYRLELPNRLIFARCVGFVDMGFYFSIFIKFSVDYGAKIFEVVSE